MKQQQTPQPRRPAPTKQDTPTTRKHVFHNFRPELLKNTRVPRITRRSRREARVGGGSSFSRKEKAPPKAKGRVCAPLSRRKPHGRSLRRRGGKENRGISSPGFIIQAISLGAPEPVAAQLVNAAFFAFHVAEN